MPCWASAFFEAKNKLAALLNAVETGGEITYRVPLE